MKLYTENQVKYILDLAQRSGVHIAKISVDVYKKLTPIELPTDEEIEEGFKFNNESYYIFIEGAKWIKEQIIKKANEK
jgi:hypothetical protein